MIVVKLNRLELHLAAERAKVRAKDKWKNRYNESGDQELSMQMGFAGEIAFCKMANIYPSFDLKFGDTSKDCLTKKFGKVDVKTIESPSRNMIVRVERNIKPADHYALMERLDENTFEFHGMMSRSDFINDSRRGFLPPSQFEYFIARKDELFIP